MRGERACQPATTSSTSRSTPLASTTLTKTVLLLGTLRGPCLRRFFARIPVRVAQVACARAELDKLLLDAGVLDLTDVTTTQGVDSLSYLSQGVVPCVACLTHGFFGFGFGKGSPGDLLGHRELLMAS
jgi:hypothetical protein